MKISSNGAKILTGEKLHEIHQRISAAFEAVRQPQAVAFDAMREGSSRAAVLQMLGQSNCIEQSNITKTEHYSATEFDRRSAKLSRAALGCSHIHVSTAGRDGVWEISECRQSASDLIKEACGPAKMESKQERKRAG